MQHVGIFVWRIGTVMKGFEAANLKERPKIVTLDFDG